MHPLGSRVEVIAMNADDFLAALTPERQNEILKVAMTFGISQNDPLFSVILALQYHTDLYKSIPVAVEKAGEQSAQVINAAGESIRDESVAARQALEEELKTFLKTAPPAMQIAAQKGVLAAVSSLDTQKLVREIAGKVTDATAMYKARRMLGAGLVVVGLSAILALVAGGVLGRYVWPNVPDFERLAGKYMMQLDCKATGATTICTNRSSGTSMTFRTPERG